MDASIASGMLGHIATVACVKAWAEQEHRVFRMHTAPDPIIMLFNGSMPAFPQIAVFSLYLGRGGISKVRSQSAPVALHEGELKPLFHAGPQTHVLM